MAAKKHRLAKRKLLVLTQLIEQSRTGHVAFGFNEWIKSQDGEPMGQDWQTWSASLYLYACRCVEAGTTPYFDTIRQVAWKREV